VPDRFEGDEDALEAAVELERRAIRFASQTGLGTALRTETRGKAGEPVLGDDAPSRERIGVWLDASAIG